MAGDLFGNYYSLLIFKRQSESWKAINFPFDGIIWKSEASGQDVYLLQNRRKLTQENLAERRT